MAKCPNCGIERKDLNNPCSVCGTAAKTLPPGTGAASTKACPFCGETILDAAKKCKHCGEFLDQSLKPTTATQHKSAKQAVTPTIIVKGKREGCLLQTLNIGCLIFIISIVLTIIIFVGLFA